MPTTPAKKERSLCQPMPAPGAYSVTSTWLEASWRVACEGFGARANSYQKLRQIVGLCEPAAVEIVTPAIGNGAAPTGEAVEFELPKRLAEKIERRVTGAHSIFSVQALWQICGRHGRPARPWPRSLPSGGDRETGSG